METYPKIMTLFKRHLDGPKKGKMIRGVWTTPELEYLAGNEWTFSAKVDGTNVRIGFKQNRLNSFPNPEFAGRSDNAILPKPLLEHLESTFTKELFLDNELSDIILFGEGYGPKIQNGGNYRHDQSFILFDVRVGDFWLSRENVADVAKKLGIEVVPEIGRGTLYDAIDIVSTGITFTDTGAIKRWGNGGLRSQWGDFFEEGIVARPVVDLFDRKGQRIICKIKHVDFK